MTGPTGEHLHLPHAALSLCAHPSTAHIAAGLSTGGLVVAPFPASSSTLAAITHPCEHPCRAVAFLPDSDRLLASTTTAEASPNTHLLDVHSATPLHSYALPAPPDAAPPCVTTFTPLSAALALAGDDAGGLHLLDARVPRAPAASALDQADYIAAVRPADAHGTVAVLAASGDGTLCAYDLRRPPHPRLKLQYATDSFNDDLLSLAVLPAADCAVAGTLSGALNVYSLRMLDAEAEVDEARLVDRFYGHPECVNAVLPVGDGALALTASTDGVVRVVDVAAKALVGVLDYAREGEQLPKGASRKRKKGGDDPWPIEDMVCVAGLDKPAFALLGHDQLIRFCDGSLLVDDDENPTETDGAPSPVRGEAGPTEEIQRERNTSTSKKKKKKKRRDAFEMPARKKPSSGNFFDGL